MLPYTDEVITHRRAENGFVLGRSREGRSIEGFRFGRGGIKISLIAGCHADEPVGPKLLEHLTGFLAAASPSADCLQRFDWWIIPHINPDGRQRNATWADGQAEAFDLAAYLRHAVREAPGDDIEFGFPTSARDRGARPENRAAFDWWQTEPTPFDLHVSLHGMAFAGGCWYLIDPAWVKRSAALQRRCRETSAELGYSLHDVQRHGDKGFVRIDRGFCTTPNSQAMARHFLERGDESTASLFRPSSMETIRSFGGDPLTLVSEIPLFVLPGVGRSIDPRDDEASQWKARIMKWKLDLAEGRDLPVATGVEAVPVVDHMRMQWEFVRAGIQQITASRD